MGRADRVDSLLACVTLNGSLLRREAEGILCMIRRYSAVEHANLVILAFTINFVLLEVFYESVASCDTCRDNFWEGVLGLTRRLQRLIVILDRLERIVLCCDGRHSCQIGLAIRYVHYGGFHAIEALSSFRVAKLSRHVQGVISIDGVRAIKVISFLGV